MTSEQAPLQMNEMASAIAQWREGKGFYTPSSLDEDSRVLEKLMLVVTELGEAAEAVRHHDEANFVEEIADTFIRLMDMTGSMGIDIEAAIKEKMNVNEGRPTKHGKHL